MKAQQKLQRVAIAKATESKAKTDLAALANEQGLDTPQQAKNINDLLELIAFIEALLVVLVQAFMDGVSLFDAIDVFRSDEVRSRFGPAVDNVSDIPNEIAHLNAKEWKALANRLIRAAFGIWESLTSAST